MTTKKYQNKQKIKKNSQNSAKCWMENLTRFQVKTYIINKESII